MSTNRRTLLKAGSWAAPAIVASSTIPAYAASQILIQSGLFVSTQYNGGFVGYSGSNDSTGHATTPAAYFAAPAGSQESDINWSDATNKPTNSRMYANGEGTFTPVSTTATASPGLYGTNSGFWFSVPTTSLASGSNYVAGSQATLAAGAVFVTQVEFTIPAGANAAWPGANVTVAGQTWNKRISGSRTAQTASTAYLQTVTAAGNWVASAPINTKNADGSYTFKGTITYTTTQAISVTQTGTKYYAQTEFMPATIQMNPAYGWTYFSLTSSVQSASVTYTANGQTQSKSITGLTTTSRINP